MGVRNAKEENWIKDNESSPLTLDCSGRKGWGPEPDKDDMDEETSLKWEGWSGEV